MWCVAGVDVDVLKSRYIVVALSVCVPVFFFAGSAFRCGCLIGACCVLHVVDHQHHHFFLGCI